MGEFLLNSVLIGIGATAIFDVWGKVVAAVGLPGANWTMGGRWFAYIPRGRLVHDGIANSPSLAGETAVGWVMHYVTGIVFAAALLLIWGVGWADAPTLGPALIVGVTTVLLGWCVMSPAMGGGIAAQKRPDRWTVRAVQLTAHVVFGFGLWLTALALAAL
ncbi:DUF2938 family protein [Acuticoccus sp. MNP-M23]|uniref:DUF2938 family protein n=1 Tax=Acuticoccus sp. MNP-M23 TaxID=3072793 RepID=UPI0028159312|nr:DUF2938 family protein [Acuticoccus sp. MNP-M23]WMS42609.1 DUF2938 family protein [Acuticoccus sp. MNP-M23]